MNHKIHHAALPLAALVGAAVVLLSCESASSIGAPRVSGLTENPAPSTNTAPVHTSELAFFEGALYEWMSPAGSSSDPNQLVRACFHLGPDLTGHANGPAGRLYAIVVPGATQHACPDGSRRHDHVLSAVPGTPGYVPRWVLINVVPGPNFTQDIMPLTSEEAVLAAASSGKLTIIQTGVTILGPVIGLVQQ
jgi:hypothetical protein